MRTLKESILSDMETALSVTDDDAKNIINGDVPRLKDFRVLYSTGRGVRWKCPLLIKKFAKDVETTMKYFYQDYKAENIVGICCIYRNALYRGYLTFGLYLYDKSNIPYHINGIGGINEHINAKDAEKLIMKFIECVCNNHSILDDIANIHNTTREGRQQYFKDFVKKLEY